MNSASKILGLLLFLFLTPSQTKSQILPREGCNLHYRLIGFSFPAKINEVYSCKLEIASGYFISEDSFKKNIVKRCSSKENKIIAEVPSFGTRYTWRVIYTGKKITSTGLFHFSTLINPNVDTNVTRFRILVAAEKYKDAYVFLDGAQTLYDMNGHPVWYVPDNELSGDGTTHLRDLKITQQATITFINKANIYEINYNGDVLWKGPNNGAVSGANVEAYHHEFTRLSNGHYMVLGMESVLWDRKQPSPSDINLQPVSVSAIKDEINKPANRKTPLGTIIEYDEKGTVVWSWKSSNYFTTSDLNYYNDPLNMAIIDPHSNSFFFDEKEKVIYVSYKNISRVIKVKYPEGTVINTYGEIYKPGVPVKGNGMFCGQHSVRRSQIGCLFLFNNNNCDSGQASPKIKKFLEPANENGQLKKIWEYECTVEGDFARRFPSGGNVIELPDQSVFVCMSGLYSKVFIVSSDKQILWSALPEKWDPSEKKWNVCSQYRASIIPGRKELERLIWNDERNNLSGKTAQRP